MNNRIFKFRVWDFKSKSWMVNEDIWRLRNTKDIYFEFINPEYTDKASFVIQQFTGFLDVNNVEIYEGDIVEYKKWEDALHSRDTEYKLHQKPIKYVDGEFWPRPYEHKCEDSYYNYKLYDFRVIGNIFENPELL